MTAPTPTEERLRAMLHELADSTPIRTGPPVTPTGPVDELEIRRRDPRPARRHSADPERGTRPARWPWVATAVAGLLVVASIAVALRVGDAADPFANDPTKVPWVDLDALSGGRLAFVMDNDLFIADGSEGVTRRITDVGRGNEVSYVSWSHDGEWLAFTVHDESGIWVVRRDGSERHRLPGRSDRYRWSPTDDELAYAEQDEVRVGQVDGSWRALEGNLPPMGYTDVVWSPDGSRVAFAGVQGNLEIGTLAGRPGAGWHAGATPPIASVVAWPGDDHLVVREPGDNGSLLAYDPASARWSALVTPDRGFTAADDLGIDQAGERMVIVTDAELWSCPLDRGVDAGCSALGAPGRGLSTPRVVPGADEASFITADEHGAAQVVMVSLAPEATSRPRVPVGPVDSSFRGTVLIPGSGGFGVEPEPQIPLRGGFLVRVDEGPINLLDTSGAGDDRVVVAGARFDRPADDYPGGSGLAYWHP